MPTPSSFHPRRCNGHGRVPALLAVVLALAAALNLPAPALAQDLRPFLETQLEMERQLLADDLRQYAAARERQKNESAAVEELLAGIDEQIEGGTVTLGDLEQRERELAAAQLALTGAEQLAATLRQRILDHLRRTALLGTSLEAQGQSPGLRIDPLSGPWRLTLQPGNHTGLLRLRLNGAVVSGEYELDGDSQGSLRGTYSGGKLRLERVDGLRGLDSVLNGELDPARRQIDGTWTAVVLSSGGPASGTWTAVKVESGAEEKP